MKMEYSDIGKESRWICCQKQRLVWLCIDSGSHACVFNYENAMETEF